MLWIQIRWIWIRILNFGSIFMFSVCEKTVKYVIFRGKKMSFQKNLRKKLSQEIPSLWSVNQSKIICLYFNLFFPVRFRIRIRIQFVSGYLYTVPVPTDYRTTLVPTIASAPSRRLISLDNRLPVFLSIIFRPNWLHYFYLANFFLLLILFSVFLLPGSGSRSPHKMRSWIRNTDFDFWMPLLMFRI